MLVHTVFFWLKDDLSAADRDAFLVALHGLKEISTVRELYVGTPAATPPREVIDASYDYTITVLFDSLADQNAYQVSAEHDAFVAHNKRLWTRVLVYDAD